MVDKISPEARSRNMSAIRSTHTKIEDKVSRELWNRGIRFRRNVKKLKGKPDIAIKKYKIAIFIDSCFWHSCPEHGHIPKSNTDFWIEKLNRNKQRDISTTQYYRDIGWNVLRIWEHQIKNDFDGTIASIVEFITTVINFCKQSEK
ncbi:very short patch repair endonuclease [Paenibacillus ehimensis]|uniref:very short patch repair endonuclease n=1 Tax=Paenibacillus ehimensis TaxID=79264 RepID=UPI0004712587|nr:very short patch repair endonuclease [Paenibacillus ehimensis]